MQKEHLLDKITVPNVSKTSTSSRFNLHINNSIRYIKWISAHAWSGKANHFADYIKCLNLKKGIEL